MGSHMNTAHGLPDSQTIQYEAGQIALETDNGRIALACCRAVTALTGKPHTITPGIDRKFAVRELIGSLSHVTPLRAV